MEEGLKKPVHQAYNLLKIAFVILPIVAGVDKYFEFVTDWDKYLSPQFAILGKYTMSVVGVVEIVAGLGILFRTRFFAYIVALWLLAIIVNLLLVGGFLDIAARDFGLMLSALALGKLAKVCS